MDDFFNNINGTSFSVTKQAFSEARQKISPTAFIKMSDAIIKWFYKDTDFKRYNGIVGDEGKVGIKPVDSKKYRGVPYDHEIKIL